MKRTQGCVKASMYRMYGMKRTQGCVKASMYRVHGMKRTQGCVKASMLRMYGMKRAQGCVKASMYSMKRAQVSSATYSIQLTPNPFEWPSKPNSLHSVTRRLSLSILEAFFS